MNGRHDFSGVAAFSICVCLLLALGEVPEREAFGLHQDSDVERVFLCESDVDLYDIQVRESCPVRIRYFHNDGSCIAPVATPPSYSLRRSGPVDARTGTPHEARPVSSTVQRI